MYLVFTIPKELDERILLYYYSLDTYITLLHLLYWYIKVVVGVMGFISREQVFFFLQPNNTMDKNSTLIQNYPISR